MSGPFVRHGNVILGKRSLDAELTAPKPLKTMDIESARASFGLFVTSGWSTIVG